MKKELRLMEIRAVIEPEEANEMIVEGYAVRFDEPTMLYEYEGTKYYEVIDRSALNKADLTDVPFKYNHSDNVMIMARTRSRTLQLLTDEQGLFIRASLANTTAGRDLYELIKRGDIDKMSFAFTVDQDSYDRETKTRTIKSIKKLWDVAAVDTPAYDTTSISARSLFHLDKEKELKALDNAMLAKRLKAKAKILKSKGWY
jgi:uncharacterized protein